MEVESRTVRERLMGASSEGELQQLQDQLVAEGYEKKSVQNRASEVRKEKGFKNGKALLPTKAMPIEALIEAMPEPDGISPVFVAGAKWAEYNILRGIRLAQELSSMGIQQAKPVVEMAKEMRQAEGQAAQVAVNEALARAMGYMDRKLEEQPKYTTPNPLSEMMARVMEVPLKNVLGRILGGPGLAQQGTTVPGWTYEEVERKERND